MIILGICLSYQSSACLMVNGEIKNAISGAGKMDDSIMLILDKLDN